MSTQKDYGSPILNEISKFKPDGFVLYFPTEKLEFYPQIKRILLKAGGVYRKNTFVFEDSAQEIQEALLNGEDLNDKKKYQYFPTPDDLSQEAVDLLDIKPSDQCLEPSCGRGAIANKIKEKSDNLTVVEIMPSNIRFLKSIGYSPIEVDFLTLTSKDIGKFDKICANPPFTKDQDIKHILHMFNEFLNENGKLVTYASCSFLNPSNKRQKAFLEWLNDVGAVIEEIPAKKFKSSGTNIPTTRITINK